MGIVYMGRKKKSTEMNVVKQAVRWSVSSEVCI